jgi:hypothetical protein
VPGQNPDSAHAAEAARGSFERGLIGRRAMGALFAVGSKRVSVEIGFEADFARPSPSSRTGASVGSEEELARPGGKIVQEMVA